jgi:Bacterial dnaA protein helix-turn-helix
MPKLTDLDRELMLRECQATLSRFGVTFSIEDVTSKSRKGENIFARALISFILKERGYILSEIGIALGNRGHATIINALKYGKEEKQGSWRYQKAYKEITATLKIEMSGKNIDEIIKFHSAELKRLKALKKKINKKSKNEQRKS